VAVDAYLAFLNYSDKYLTFESQVVVNSATSDPLSSGLINGATLQTLASASQLCEVTDYSFDIEQTLNIGSQSIGAGAGKVTFNAFSITRKIDRASPPMYANCCAGTPFKMVSLFLRKSSGQGVDQGTAMSGVTFVRFDFKLVAVKTIAWAHDDESPTETLTFEYGALLISYAVQQPNGTMAAMQTEGWNRVQNVQDRDAKTAISAKAGSTAT
jgi:type VI secretion system secreted protein Hcp